MGRKTQFRENDLQYSLRSLMSECLDFKEEETALNYLGSQLGVQVLLTPKFHAELTGEGRVEFSWGNAKAFYRRILLSKQRGQENLKQCVRELSCPINELERMEKLAARARAYIICMYHHLHQQSQQRIQQDHAHTIPPMPAPPENQGLLFSEIQRLRKLFKTHRCASAFDCGFVNGSLKEAKPQKDEDDVVA